MAEGKPKKVITLPPKQVKKPVKANPMEIAKGKVSKAVASPEQTKSFSLPSKEAPAAGERPTLKKVDWRDKNAVLEASRADQQARLERKGALEQRLEASKKRLEGILDRNQAAVQQLRDRMKSDAVAKVTKAKAEKDKKKGKGTTRSEAVKKAWETRKKNGEGAKDAPKSGSGRAAGTGGLPPDMRGGSSSSSKPAPKPATKPAPPKVRSVDVGRKFDREL